MTIALEEVFGLPHRVNNWRNARACQWIVRGFLARGGVTMISAGNGRKKSLHAADLAIRLAAGEPGSWLGAFELSEGPFRCAVIEAENGADRMDRRIKELVLGGSFPAELVDLAEPALFVFSAELIRNRGAVIEHLAALVSELALDVVILDPLRSFYPQEVQDENGNIETGRTIDTLVSVAKRSRSAILVLDHDTKAGGALRGGSAKGDAAEIVWHMTNPNEDDPDLTEFRALKQRDPGGARKLCVRTIRGSETEDGFFPIRFERVAESATQGSAAQQVIAWLISNGPASQKEIANGTGLHPNTVKSAVSRLTKGDEVLIVTGRTKYGSPILAVRGSFSQVPKGDEA